MVRVDAAAADSHGQPLITFNLTPVVVAAACTLHASIMGAGSTNHFQPVLFFFFFFYDDGNQLLHTSATLFRPRNSPQWLSELR